jgi:stage V sporulation protein AC
MNTEKDTNQQIEQRNADYAKYVEKLAPRSKMFPSLLWAFLVGGLICCIGESLYIMWAAIFPAMHVNHVGSLVASTLITIAAILTAFGLYDKIGGFAGGGSAVPITGFSNAMTSAAMEYRKEGIIFGTCANMFKVAGPVIVIGAALSMLVGFIYWILIECGVNV